MSLTPKEAERHGLSLNKDGQRRSAFELLSYPNIGCRRSRENLAASSAHLQPKIAEQIEIDAKYDVYLSRQAADIAAYRRDESFALPDDLDYAALPGLSNEVKQKLAAHKPRTIGHAGKIDGVTPAALTLAGGACPARPPQGGEKRLSKRGQGARRSAADRAGRSSSRLFHVKHWRGWMHFVDLLLTWQARINLIAASTIPHFGRATSPIRCSSCALAPQAQNLGGFRLGRRISRPSRSPARSPRARRASPSH